jgi:type I restriction enzyme S subunit
MREGWKEVKLANYYTISSGLSKSADQFGSGFPFVSFKNVFWNFFLPKELTELVNTTEKDRITCSVKKGDVFLTRTSEKIEELGMSAVALIDYPNATFNGFTKRLRPINDKEIDPKFIGFYLRTPQFRAEITAYSTLTTRASLNNDIIGRLRILLPSLQTQRKIASILSSYDDLIENNLKRIKLLEEKAQLTYEEWFVKMRFPGYERTKFDAVTGLPEGWEKVKLIDIIDFKVDNRGRNPNYYCEKGIPVLDNHLINNSPYVNLNNAKRFLDEELYDNFIRKYLEPNDVLITLVGTVGNIAMAPKSKCSIIQNTIGLRCNDLCNQYFLYWFLKLNKQSILNYNRGSAQPSVKVGDLLSINIDLPNVSQLKNFEKYCKLIFDLIINIGSQNQILKEARDILLPRLMSGMIDPDKISGQVGEEMEMIQTT